MYESCGLKAKFRISKIFFLDEARCYCQNDEAENFFDESFEKLRNLDFSGLHYKKEAFDQMCEELEIPPKLAAYCKDNFVKDPALSPEECFKNGVRLAKEFYRIEQKQH